MDKRHTEKDGRYRCAFVKKVVSRKNRQERAVYDGDYIYDPIFGFFDYIVHTDRVHVDPISQAQGRLLLE